ncbi:MAG: hypothetical protein EHM71_12725, partial [Zetaproteobacteria bacterium]
MAKTLRLRRVLARRYVVRRGMPRVPAMVLTSMTVRSPSKRNSMSIAFSTDLMVAAMFFSLPRSGIPLSEYGARYANASPVVKREYARPAGRPESAAPPDPACHAVRPPVQRRPSRPLWTGCAPTWRARSWPLTRGMTANRLRPLLRGTLVSVRGRGTPPGIRTASPLSAGARTGASWEIRTDGFRGNPGRGIGCGGVKPAPPAGIPAPAGSARPIVELAPPARIGETTERQASGEMTSRIVTADEAARLIPDGATVAICGCLSMLEPDTVLGGIEGRFLREGRPRDLTVIHPVMVGSRKGAGINRLAHDGLMRRVIGGSFSIFADYEITAMITQDRVEAYNLPIGTILHWLRESGAGRPGLFTDVGLHTYVDPRVEGGRANGAARGALSEVVRVRDRDYLFYPSLHVDAAIVRGTSIDPLGNISIEHEPASLGIYALAVAAKHSGGAVIAQVKRRVESGSVHPRLTVVPGRLVDAVVVDPAQPQVAAGERPEIAGEVRTLLAPEPVPPTLAAAIARRAARELRDGQLVNLGYGVPALIPALGFAQRLHERVAFSIEHGSVGGLPDGMATFGASANPDLLMDSTLVFDMYDGGLLDVTALGLAQADRHGNVNVSRFAHMAPGSGGFCNICHRTKKILLCGTFTAGGLEAEFVGGRLVIRREGKVKKFVSRVKQITLSGKAAQAKGQEVLFLTERAVFRLTPEGLALIEAAPGIDPATHILPQMEFSVRVPPGLPVMDPAIF